MDNSTPIAGQARCAYNSNPMHYFRSIETAEDARMKALNAQRRQEALRKAIPKSPAHAKLKRHLVRKALQKALVKKLVQKICMRRSAEKMRSRQMIYDCGITIAQDELRATKDSCRSRRGREFVGKKKYLAQGNFTIVQCVDATTKQNTIYSGRKRSSFDLGSYQSPLNANLQSLSVSGQAQKASLQSASLALQKHSLEAQGSNHRRSDAMAANDAQHRQESLRKALTEKPADAKTLKRHLLRKTLRKALVKKLVQKVCTRRRAEKMRLRHVISDCQLKMAKDKLGMTNSSSYPSQRGSGSVAKKKSSLTWGTLAVSQRIEARAKQNMSYDAMTIQHMSYSRRECSFDHRGSHLFLPNNANIQNLSASGQAQTASRQSTSVAWQQHNMEAKGSDNHRTGIRITKRGTSSR